MSTLTAKSWKDIRRRWARSLFTVATIAFAVAGLGLFAVPVLMDRAMDGRVESDRLQDIRFRIEDTQFTADEAAELRQLPGVESAEFRTVFWTQVEFNGRREDAVLIGVPDFAGQSVNVVRVSGGALPAGEQALTDIENADSGRLKARTGDTVQVEDNSGTLHALQVSGSGGSLEYSQLAAEDAVVLYAAQETVNRIASAEGFDTIEVRATDPAAAQALAASVAEWLTARHPDIVFTELPETREAGTWPGQDIFNNFITLFYVGAFIALISAVALISNTMTTMVAEQRREIAVMKAIGGGRRAVGMSYLRTAGMLASAGSLLGALVGIPFGNYMTQLIGTTFFAISPEFGVVWTVVLVSFLVGAIGTTLAAVPALISAARTPVRVGLQSAITPAGASTKLLRRLPVPTSVGIGLRNIARRKTRALGTMVQVGLAVGAALGFLALGVTFTTVTGDQWDKFRWDVLVYQSSNVALDDNAGEVLSGIEGVEDVHPMLYNNVRLDGVEYEAWGFPADRQFYTPLVERGRWLEAGDDAAGAPLVVAIGVALANKLGLEVGDPLTFETARGPVTAEIVGIDENLVNNGTGIFIPLERFQALLGRDDANAYWVLSASQEESAIDRLAIEAEDRLTAAGYPSGTQIQYVDRAANISDNRMLVNVLTIIAIPIVAIGLIGLVSMMTMNVIERTREIGILRCLGASSGNIQRIFRAEALAVAFLGWVLAVPIGWVVGKALVLIVANLFNFGDVPYYFPLLYPPLALVITLVLAALVVIAPLRRASGLRPGDALRYE